MKKIPQTVFKAIEYILFFFIFVIKPLFSKNVSPALIPSCYALLFYCIFCLWFIVSSSFDFSFSIYRKKTLYFTSSMIVPSLFVLIFLFFNMLVWNFFSTFNIFIFKKATMIAIDITNIGNLAKLCLILQLIGAACFEEKGNKNIFC